MHCRLLVLCCCLSLALVAEEQWPLGVIGQVETIGVADANLLLLARIDTGAETSSIDARKIEHFERDGTRWVRFQLPRDEDALVALECPVVRTANIKRHGAGAVERPVVVLTVILGTTALRREFSLADRSAYEYPVLIGRNVLEGQAAVDVARANCLKTRLPEREVVK